MTENDKQLSKIFQQDIAKGQGIFCMLPWLSLKIITINTLYIGFVQEKS